MNVLQALVLGFVQGVTEFFPISSSAHLIIIPRILSWPDQGLEFDAVLHLGTLMALLVFFWKDWQRMILKFFADVPSLFRQSSQLSFTERFKLLNQDSKLLIFIVLSSIPAGLAGLLFDQWIEDNLREITLISYMLIGVGFLMWLVDRGEEKNKSGEKINLKDALFIGFAQVLALIPGVSRSGITIIAGRMLGFGREASVRFSFLLATPVVLAAGVYKLTAIFAEGVSLGLLVGFLSSTLVGFLAIKFLLSLVKKFSFFPFVIYRILLAVFLLLSTSWQIAF